MVDGQRRTKAEQRAATTRRLLQVGREVFAEQGYAGASTEEIVRRAGVTRGALYHHFADKQALFAAVLADVQRDVAHRIEEAADQESGRWGQLRAGCRAFLAASLDPHVQRIMLLDAPAVLGWEAWRRLDAEHAMRLLREGLDALVAEGGISPQPVEPLTHLLSGAMNEAALWIARSPRTEQALAEATVALDHLLEGLRQAHPRGVVSAE